MVRRMTPSQFRSFARQQEQKAKNAIRRYNQEVDRVNRANKAAHDKYVREINREVQRVNQQNKRIVDNHNRDIRQYDQKRKLAISKYNQTVRARNSQLQRDKRQQLSSLRSSTDTRYVDVCNSAFDLSDQYERINRKSLIDQEILAAAEQESRNSAAVAYALNSDAENQFDSSEDTGILDYLSDLSEDLGDRWKGALYALNPENADAGRHFCTSVREIFTEILNGWASSKDVLDADPNCERTPQGTPSRRAKIRYLLTIKGADTPEMLGFVEKDIDDILKLFPVFNKATHGAAGTLSFSSLKALKQRVEGGIMFLATIATPIEN